MQEGGRGDAGGLSGHSKRMSKSLDIKILVMQIGCINPHVVNGLHVQVYPRPSLKDANYSHDDSHGAVWCGCRGAGVG